MPETEDVRGMARPDPEGFLFAVEASRFITHIKRLRDCEEPLDRLLERSRALADRLGPWLFQLPPRWTLPAERLERSSRRSSRGCGPESSPASRCGTPAV
jgi:uncharacterized protein YecE (DUF72 family)